MIQAISGLRQRSSTALSHPPSRLLPVAGHHIHWNPHHAQCAPFLLSQQGGTSSPSRLLSPPPTVGITTSERTSPAHFFCPAAQANSCFHLARHPGRFPATACSTAEISNWNQIDLCSGSAGAHFHQDEGRKEGRFCSSAHQRHKAMSVMTLICQAHK